MTEHPPEDRLDSWKEIAAYLGRGIRTVQRWEQEEGLPVHRLAHEKRGSIYARREELAAWWKSRRRMLADSSAVPAVVAPRLERVTFTAGLTSWPALSSDARLIAYVSDAGQDGSTPQIWVPLVNGTIDVNPVLPGIPPLRVGSNQKIPTLSGGMTLALAASILAAGLFQLRRSGLGF